MQEKLVSESALGTLHKVKLKFPKKFADYIRSRIDTQLELPAESLIEELIKFLILQSNIQNLQINIGKALDEVWHALLLETKIYSEMCNFIMPGFFVHHSSSFFSEHPGLDPKKDLKAEALEVALNYKNMFLEITEDSCICFPQIEILSQRWASGLNDLNLRLKLILESR